MGFSSDLIQICKHHTKEPAPIATATSFQNDVAAIV